MRCYSHVEEGLRFAFRYKTDPQIKAMTDLVDAYQRREVHLAEKILKGLYNKLSHFN